VTMEAELSDVTAPYL